MPEGADLEARRQIISAAQADVLQLAKGSGLRGRNLEKLALNLMAILGRSYGQRSSPELSVKTAVDAIDRRDFLAPPSFPGRAHGAGRALPGKDWAEVLRMLLNLDNSSQNLGERQRSFVIPNAISLAYGVTTSTSSRFRSEVCRDAAWIFAAFVHDAGQAVAPIDDAAPSLPGVIQRAIGRQIGAHSYLEPEWVSALSGQYFLILLGRMRTDEQRSDYRELLDTFLETFNPRADDTLVLNERNVLVTPDELARMKQRMVEEDQSDDFFTRTARTRAENIDPDLLHKNYLYGLILGIAAQRGSRTMTLVHDIALEHLASDRGPALDHAGGWAPYRIPWITARVLLSLRELDDEILTPPLRSTIARACHSLLERMLPDKTWRSGVGTWLAPWESTGLCLEALLAWPEYCDRSVFEESLTTVWNQRAEWMTAPDLTSEEGANATLAASVLCADLVTAPPSEEARVACLRHLALVLAHAEMVAVPETRQYCTIPQIIYYGAKATGGQRRG